MPSPTDFYDLIVEEWRRRGVALKPPAFDAEVTRVFADLGYPLSDDVRRLYAVANGFVDGESDRLWSLWSLDQIREENGPKRKPFVKFADWLISSHLYAFHYESPETSSVYISNNGWSLEPEPIAHSLAEFLETLLCSPDDVEAWPLEKSDFEAPAKPNCL